MTRNLYIGNDPPPPFQEKHGAWYVGEVVWITYDPAAWVDFKINSMWLRNSGSYDHRSQNEKKEKTKKKGKRN